MYERGGGGFGGRWGGKCPVLSFLPNTKGLMDYCLLCGRGCWTSRAPIYRRPSLGSCLPFKGQARPGQLITVHCLCRREKDNERPFTDFTALLPACFHSNLREPDGGQTGRGKQRRLGERTGHRVLCDLMKVVTLWTVPTHTGPDTGQGRDSSPRTTACSSQRSPG